MIELYKPRTAIRDILTKTASLAEILIMLDDALGDESFPCFDTIDYSNGSNLPRVCFCPPTPEDARRITGRLIRAFGFGPKVKKEDDTSLRARFEFAGYTVEVLGYRTANCRLVEKEVKVPATKKRVIPAQPARVEKKMVLVCDKGESAPAAEPEPEEVPW